MNEIQSSEALPGTALLIPVLLFAALKEAAGTERIEVAVPAAGASEKVSIEVLMACCGHQFPVLEPWLPYVRVAVNCEYSQSNRLIGASDEIALLPPVSGGAFAY